MNGELVHWFTKSKGNGGDKMKKHCILWTVVITLIVSWFLFFPWSKQVLEDGGTIVYSSFTYKIYIWNSIGGKNTTEIYYFIGYVINFHCSFGTPPLVLSLACDIILQEALFSCPHRLHLFHSPKNS